jgi:hypothetical protein
MPILGILASQISGHLWAPSGAYDALATVTVPAGQTAASIVFAGIPTGYKHLQIRMVYNNTTASDIYFNLNSNYGLKGHYLYGNGSSAGAGVWNPSSTKGTAIDTGQFSTTIPVACIVDILDYSNTNKYKTLRSIGGQDTNGGGSGQAIWLSSALFDETAAVSSVTIKADYNFNQYTQVALFGVK